jgi:aspartate/methionine/tyrosine aminotransferase
MGYRFPMPAGTYFIMLPISQKTDLDDVAFCEKLIMEQKVATIPPSAFYLKADEGKKFLRICFAKKEATLRAAIKNLRENLE